MPRKLFIGDIHGCLRTFCQLLVQMRHTRADTLYLLGDYIDRGPDSKGVIDHIIALRAAGYPVVALRGNHEQMLLRDHYNETTNGWHDLADDALKASFGIPNLTELPTAYLDFCNSLPLFHAEADFIAVHAGLNFERGDPQLDDPEVIWIRDWYRRIDYSWLGHRTVLHGHTPLPRQEIEDLFANSDTRQVINLDCGAFAHSNKANGFGYLCGLDWTNRQLYFQENIEFESGAAL